MINPDLIRDSKLKIVASKVLSGEPADREDAIAMLETMDIPGLGIIANHVRESLNGNTTYYGVNININYTNICELRCPLCAFSCDNGDPQAYLYSLDDIERIVRDADPEGIDEVHIVGGLHPDLKLDYFTGMLRRIKSVNPRLFIVAFTAVEYDYFAKVNGMSLRGIFQELIDAGLGALPGGGAEIFAQAKRGVIAPKKIPADRWLEVMETAHSMGLTTNATMLYNHVESNEDIVDHINRIRELQSRTGGFKTFVPLQFHEENTTVKTGRGESSGFTDLRIYATARVFLHNLPHIKALWMYLGEKMACVLQDFGVDDIGATYNREKVVHSAGAKTADHGSEIFLKRLITSAGRAPVRSAADYRGVENL